MLRRLAPLVLFALSLIASIEADAQPVDDTTRARQLFVEGARLAEAGRWDAARERFEESVRLKRAALTLYNLGIAQQETGRLTAALESFRAFLAQPVEPATQAYVAPVREVVTKLEARVARVEIDVRPAGIRGVVIRLDGRDLGAPTGPLIVDPGPHEVVAVAPGHGEVRQKTTLPEGARATLAVTFALTPDRRPSLALPAGLGIAGLALFVGGEVVFAVGAQRASTTPPGGGATAMMIAGNAVAGAGAVAAGVGLALLLKRSSAARNAAVQVSPAGVPELALRF